MLNLTRIPRLPSIACSQSCEQLSAPIVVVGDPGLTEAGAIRALKVCAKWPSLDDGHVQTEVVQISLVGASEILRARSLLAQMMNTTARR